MFGGPPGEQERFPADEGRPLGRGGALGGKKLKQVRSLRAVIHGFDSLLTQPGEKLLQLTEGIVAVIRIQRFEKIAQQAERFRIPGSGSRGGGILLLPNPGLFLRQIFFRLAVHGFHGFFQRFPDDIRVELRMDAHFPFPVPEPAGQKAKQHGRGHQNTAGRIIIPDQKRGDEPEDYRQEKTNDAADPEAAFFDFLPRSPGQQKPKHIPHGRRLTVRHRLALPVARIGSAVAQKHTVENLVQAVDALPAVLVDGGVCLKLGADLILFCQEQTAHIYGIHGGHLMIAVVLSILHHFPASYNNLYRVYKSVVR